MNDYVMQRLMWLISRAELTGSRGRAKYYGRPEPIESDYDWTIWTNDPAFAGECDCKARAVVHVDPEDFRYIPRRDGFTLHSVPLKIDISVYPTRRRDVLRLAWAMLEGGAETDKLVAWRAAHAQLHYPCDD